MSNPQRPCFVLREVQVDFEDLKKGDIFRLGKADETDTHLNENRYYMAQDHCEIHPENDWKYPPSVIVDYEHVIDINNEDIKKRFKGV